MASEYANRNAYDCIQVHGGSGFMKEYACERLYRDARILSIYEGTSQLQVVAAQKGIANGAYIAKIEEYDARTIHSELEPLREMLREATENYKVLAEMASANAETDYDFRRMQTDVIASIIMGYLLIDDVNRQLDGDDSCKRSFMPSARYMAAFARAESVRSVAMAKAYSK